MEDFNLFLMALVPVLWLIISLGVFKIPAYIATTIGLIITFIIAVTTFSFPVYDTIFSSYDGFALGLWPIMYTIIAALFSYNLLTYTKSIEVIKTMLSNITTDRRIQVLILAWGFGGFLESVAGYGTAVAIPASILISLGFNPLFAAIISIIANTVPTAFGAVGIPVITLAEVTSLDVVTLSYYIALQLTVFIIIIPFILVILTEKSIKGLKGAVGISLVSGLSFAIPHLLIAKYIGPELPSLVGSLVSLGATIYYAKRLNKDNKVDSIKITKKQALNAWMPYILIFVFVILSSPIIPPFHDFLAHFKTSFVIYNEPFTIKWIITPGTLIILATFIGGFIQGVSFKEMLMVLLNTIKKLTKSIVTVLAIVALAKIMGNSGMTNVISNVIVSSTGQYFPLLSPIIGSLGTFITGSDTSANVLFGPLQSSVAQSIDINPYWLAAANTSGATAGKMISPQSIAIATSAAGLIGSEGKILNKTIVFCLGYVVILGILVYFVGPLF